MSKHKTLSPAENAYVATLARRVLWLQEQADALRSLPLEAIHEETGLHVFEVLCMMADAVGYTELELNEVLDS